LLRALQASRAEWGAPTAVNLPAISTTPAEMADALARAAGEHAKALIDWTPDARISAIVAGWPARFDTARASALGLAPDVSVDALVQAYVDERAAT
jgi:nucleoside-diphosphate-sugar epimerase